MLVHAVLQEAEQWQQQAAVTAAVTVGGAAHTSISTGGGSLAGCLAALAAEGLSLAPNSLLGELLRGLQPLLVYSHSRRGWAAFGMAPLLRQLQQACQVGRAQVLPRRA